MTARLDSELVVPSRPTRWWQHDGVRLTAGAATTIALLSSWLFFPQGSRWELPVSGSGYLELTTMRLELVVGLLLMPFMRRVSYRKRDVLLVVLVPFYGEIVAGKMVYRLLSLPRRDWVPRPDELPRVVRIPHSRGAYLVRDTFEEAEELRTRWCVNPEHHHPFPSWSAAQQVGCSRARGGLLA